VSNRNTSAPADRWRPVAVGVWFRDPVSARSPSALVRQARSGLEMRIGGGAWLPAGETLLAATEHASGHAARLELMAERGGDDLCGDCAICARAVRAAKEAKENGR